MEEILSSDEGIMSSQEEEQNLATEGIISDEIEDTPDVWTIDDEDDNQDELDKELEQQRKKAEKAKKLLAERTQLKNENSKLKDEVAIKDLKLLYGQFDETAVLELKSKHSSLTHEQAYKLRKSEQPQPEKPIKQSTIVWSEARNLWVNTISKKELLWLDQWLYNIAMDKIASGKLRLEG